MTAMKKQLFFGIAGLVLASCHTPSDLESALALADDNRLVYPDVPRGALLWLENHTRGWDERAFVYENNRQIWW